MGHHPVPVSQRHPPHRPAATARSARSSRLSLAVCVHVSPPVCSCGAHAPLLAHCRVVLPSQRVVAMDNTTLLAVGTVVLGLVGVAVFMLMQPAPTKSRSDKSGLKPRGVYYAVPKTARQTLLILACDASVAEDLYTQ
jgi:hypothetical protein